jgi:hypothetical protein
MTVSVAVRADGALTYYVPGQPLYELRFTHGLHFVLAGILGVSIEFRRTGAGAVIGLAVHQQSGDIFLPRTK